MPKSMASPTKLTFDQVLESQSQMVFCFEQTHCFNHIFAKFKKNWRWATNFFCSLFSLNFLRKNQFSILSKFCWKIIKFQDFLCIFLKFCKMTFYQFLESKGQMVFHFGKTHCFNHIFPKFCNNCRRATNFFGSQFESSCSLFWAFLLIFLKEQRLVFFWANQNIFSFFPQRANFVL